MPKPTSPPHSFRTLLEGQIPASIAAGLLADPLVREANAKYRPWRKVAPIAQQAGRDPSEMWATIKVARMVVCRELPLRAENGRPFVLAILPSLNEELHKIDQACGGGPVAALDTPGGLLSDTDLRRRFIIRSTMEEAIESSRIEGAVTTRELALDLLRSGRQPRTTAEIMVANNYTAMQKIKSWLRRPLSSEMLCELQEILTRGTIDDEKSGRFRREDESVAVVDERTGEVIFTPPAAGLLESRVAAVCDFANASHDGEHFIHPLVKASVLHFMIGYEHPFVDGNGRTARAVFYWHALRSGYRIFEYLAISELIRAAYAKYPRAFIDTETDDNDVTYFVRYKLDVIRRSLDRLAEHLRKEEEEITRSLRLVRLNPDLNLRQRLLLEHALRHPKTAYTAKSHARSNSITTTTARTDLEQLKGRGFLSSYKVGREVHYTLSPDLPLQLAATEGA